LIQRLWQLPNRFLDLQGHRYPAEVFVVTLWSWASNWSVSAMPWPR
jgi:hypothetical protein